VRIRVDVNLSPSWVGVLASRGHEATHWTAIGDPRASDREIMDWARANGHVVFTHDLDFGVLLALTRASGPSVVQVRTQDVLPSAIAGVVTTALQQHEAAITSGAIVSIDEATSRVRVLPILP
jgi:predicted nuclease of predicted toxin-antitoxin system